MINIINTRLSLKARRRLYRILFTLSEMDFRFIRPVFFGSMVFFLLLAKANFPESAKTMLSATEIAFYYSVLIFNFLCLLIFSRPHIRHLIGRLKVRAYRRKKRACTTLFL